MGPHQPCCYSMSMGMIEAANSEQKNLFLQLVGEMRGGWCAFQLQKIVCADLDYYCCAHSATQFLMMEAM